MDDTLDYHNSFDKFKFFVRLQYKIIDMDITEIKEPTEDMTTEDEPQPTVEYVEENSMSEQLSSINEANLNFETYMAF